jgi:hypothetical protein
LILDSLTRKTKGKGACSDVIMVIIMDNFYLFFKNRRRTLK